MVLEPVKQLLFVVITAEIAGIYSCSMKRESYRKCLVTPQHTQNQLPACREMFYGY